jgi:hypothetical protein
LAERLTVNQVVGGSIPLAPANIKTLGYGLVVKLSADNGAIASSILATPTTHCRVDKWIKSPVSETGVCRFESYLGTQWDVGDVGIATYL